MKKILFSILVGLGCQWETPAQQRQATPAELQALYIQAFGDRIRLDPKKVQEVLSGDSGAGLRVDENGDGGVDAVYFIDNDRRHLARYQPIVVKAVAPSGNFSYDQLDTSHVLLVADWHGDAILDRVVAHLDDDGDSDLDRMLLSTPWSIGPIHLVMVEDISDDNRLWFHRNYQYDVATGWWRSDWNGDEVFYFFAWDPARRKWIPRAEAPFAFYDTDRDGFADVSLRLESRGRQVESFRYSFDIDRDANPFQPHDYDFSLTGLGPAEIPEPLTVRTHIGVAETEGYLPWSQARQWLEKAEWKSVALTWDEADNNVDLQSPNRFGEGENHEGFRNERWEGVLNHPTESFPQVGGPSAGPFNRRTEIDLDNSGRMELYYSPVDRRIHLFGAEYGFQLIDFNLDGRADMEIRLGDRDRDGYVDTWEIDVDRDGIVDRSYGYSDRMSPDADIPHASLPTALTLFYSECQRKALNDNIVLIELMRSILKIHENNFRVDEAEDFFLHRLGEWESEHGLGEKMRASLDAQRFYADVIRERYFNRVLTILDRRRGPRRELLKVYGRGHYDQTVELLGSYFGVRAVPEKAEGVLLSVTNRSDEKLWKFPIVVDLHSQFPEHSAVPDGIAVFESMPALAPEPVTSQADDLDADGRADELVFMTSLRAGETRTYRLQWRRPSQPVAAHSRAFISAGRILWDSGYARFEWDDDNKIWFSGKHLSTVDNREGEAAHAGEEARAQIARLQLSDIQCSVESNKPLGLKVLREGPVRLVLGSMDRQLLIIGYAGQLFSEIRWMHNSRPLHICFSDGRKTTPLTGAAGAFRYHGTWNGEIGVGIIWPTGSRIAVEENGLRAFRGGDRVPARVWTTGYWRVGDRKPFWPALSNWERSLERLARVLGGLSYSSFPTRQEALRAKRYSRTRRCSVRT